jgi:hypothetical protein
MATRCTGAWITGVGPNAQAVDIVMEKPVQSDGTTDTYYVPIDEIALVHLRVLKSSA